MKIYLVGGAVRDQLLGLPIKERDWVVVGETPEKMRGYGFQQVGRNFPVFLHPKTHEEYALARTERKTGKGHTEFVCFADPTVSLEDDLRRRDLTINAMAQTLDGKLIDPYDGLQDIKNKILRHVSPTFIEDPLRILRVARFAARFGDFTVHPDTIALMRDMSYAGEVDALVAERVWQEFEKALKEPYPERFFEILQCCGALQKLFPEISMNLPLQLKILKQAVKLTKEPEVRFAAFMSYLNPEEIKMLCRRYRPPKIYLQLSLLVAKNLKTFVAITVLPEEDIATLLESIDAFRRTKRFEQFLLACFAAVDDSENQQKLLELWHTAYLAAKNVAVIPLVQAGYTGETLRKKIHASRVDVIKAMKSQFESELEAKVV